MKTLRILGLSLLVLLLSSLLANSQSSVGGTWSPVAAAGAGPNSPGTALLLTDGTVIVHDGLTANWFRLTPDNKGNYDTPQATWTAYAALPNIGGRPYAPLYFASAVLANAQVIVEGGEYINGETNINNPNPANAVWSTKGAIIDPRAMNPAWAAVTRPAGWGDGNMQNGTGDAQSAILPDRRFLLANALTKEAAYYTPMNNPPWIAAGTAGKLDINDEEGWNLLPNGTLLTVDAYVQQNKVGMNSEIYDPAAAKWASGGSTMALIPDVGRPLGNTHEVGPAVLRPDGTVIYFGASTLPLGNFTHNAVYNTITKKWAPAPDPKNNQGRLLTAQDGPASILPCGKVLVEEGLGLHTPGGVIFFEWDGTNIYQIQNQPALVPEFTFTSRMLVLPNGQVLLTDYQLRTVQVYTANPNECPPDPGSVPVVKTAPGIISAGITYTISGTQFNGLSQGAAYGNDAQSATNYPLVYLVGLLSKDVVFCTTHDHTSMGVATGNLIVSTNFECPNTIEIGVNTLYVVANGISSAGTPVIVE